jgi:multidrug efflux pump subunit AcrB
LIVELNLWEIEAKNVDIMQVYQALKKNNLSLPVWNIIWKNKEKIFVETNWKINNKEELKKLIIWNFNWNIVYLEDIANIKLATKKIDKISNITTANWTEVSVFLWIWKALWKNAVFVTKDVVKKLDSIKKELPQNIDIKIISNEW